MKEHILLKEVMLQTPTVVVNGVAQESQEIPQTIMVCPHCGRVIQAFQQGIPYVEVVKALSKDNTLSKKMEENSSYCPKCGTQLSFDFDIVDGTFDVVNVEEEPKIEESKEEVAQA